MNEAIARYKMMHKNASESELQAFKDGFLACVDVYVRVLRRAYTRFNNTTPTDREVIGRFSK